MPSIKKVKQEIPVKMDLCGELLPGQLLVEVFGSGRVLIENHCGIVKYEPDEICVKAKCIMLHISGSAMVLAKMSREQLVITGEIKKIQLEKRAVR